MSKIVGEIKNILRPVKHLLFSLAGYAYDFYRYLKYAGWNIVGRDKRGYRAVKIYHRLEKSLSFRQRKLGAGSEAVFALNNLFSEKNFKADTIDFQERVGLKVLGDFISENASGLNSSGIGHVYERLKVLQASDGGVLKYSESKLLEGRLDSPEKFFFSRYSVRDFQEKAVSKELISRAVGLAMKSPSVCSRQAWHVYHIDDRALIDKALTFQNGNRGFGHEVPSLLILTADLAAFDTSSERYQCWIDGGMFSMSVVYAFHSLGIASCCLNWSKGVFDDIKFRKAIPIKSSHSILMLLAVGYARENIKVCCSARRPLSEVLTHLEPLADRNKN